MKSKLNNCELHRAQYSPAFHNRPPNYPVGELNLRKKRGESCCFLIRRFHLRQWHANEQRKGSASWPRCFWRGAAEPFPSKSLSFIPSNTLTTPTRKLGGTGLAAVDRVQCSSCFVANARARSRGVAGIHRKRLVSSSGKNGLRSASQTSSFGTKNAICRQGTTAIQFAVSGVCNSRNPARGQFSQVCRRFPGWQVPRSKVR